MTKPGPFVTPKNSIFVAVASTSSSGLLLQMLDPMGPTPERIGTKHIGTIVLAFDGIPCSLVSMLKLFNSSTEPNEPNVSAAQ